MCEKLKEYLNGNTSYTEKYVRMKLESHFGENVILTGIRGKRNVVTSSSWTQFIGNNMDHQVRTLDDAGTFHGMGIQNSGWGWNIPWDGHSEHWMVLEHSMGWALSWHKTSPRSHCNTRDSVMHHGQSIYTLF